MEFLRLRSCSVEFDMPWFSKAPCYVLVYPSNRGYSGRISVFVVQSGQIHFDHFRRKCRFTWLNLTRIPFYLGLGFDSYICVQQRGCGFEHSRNDSRIMVLIREIDCSAERLDFEFLTFIWWCGYDIAMYQPWNLVPCQASGQGGHSWGRVYWEGRMLTVLRNMTYKIHRRLRSSMLDKGFR